MSSASTLTERAGSTRKLAGFSVRGLLAEQAAEGSAAPPHPAPPPPLRPEPLLGLPRAALLGPHPHPALLAAMGVYSAGLDPLLLLRPSAVGSAAGSAAPFLQLLPPAECSPPESSASCSPQNPGCSSSSSAAPFPAWLNPLNDSPSSSNASGECAGNHGDIIGLFHVHVLGPDRLQLMLNWDLKL